MKDTPFDDMIDIMFDGWLIEFSRRTEQDKLDFKNTVREAFRAGWLECEKFYEKP